MPQSERERSIIKHLASVVMGWTLDIQEDKAFAITKDGDRIRLWSPHSLMPCWNPLADTTLGKGQAMEVWERAREMGIRLELAGRSGSTWYCSWKPTYCVTEDSGPRALMTAIALATGWEEQQDQNP